MDICHFQCLPSALPAPSAERNSGFAVTWSEKRNTAPANANMPPCGCRIQYERSVRQPSIREAAPGAEKTSNRAVGIRNTAPSHAPLLSSMNAAGNPRCLHDHVRHAVACFSRDEAMLVASAHANALTPEAEVRTLPTGKADATLRGTVMCGCLVQSIRRRKDAVPMSLSTDLSWSESLVVTSSRTRRSTTSTATRQTIAQRTCNSDRVSMDATRGTAVPIAVPTTSSRILCR